jgi:hypothetical protein
MEVRMIQLASELLQVLSFDDRSFTACNVGVSTYLPSSPIRSLRECHDFHRRSCSQAQPLILFLVLISSHSLFVNTSKCLDPRVARCLLVVEAEDHLKGEAVPGNVHQAHQGQLAPSPTISEVLAIGKVGFQGEQGRHLMHDHP